MRRRTAIFSLALSLLMHACQLRGEDASDTMVSYLHRYNDLTSADVEGRLSLAEWCASHGLLQQQGELLTEVLKLQPANAAVYQRLLTADAKWNRAVDSQWAAKLQGLLGATFHLHHSLHFTLLTDVDDATADVQAEALESTYVDFYRETVAIGLHPMPPPGRLVCVFFDKYDDYRDFLRRFEDMAVPWAAGFYSWRTNRSVFYHDRDNPVFKTVRDGIADTDQHISSLREEMRKLSETDTAGRLVIQSDLKRLVATRTVMSGRLAEAGRLATLGKTRHEATHQLFYNSGLLRRARDYPFWLNEGLAMLFEICDADGHTGPKLANEYRMRTYRQAQERGELASIADVLSQHPADDEDQGHVAVRYSQVWALAWFLWNKHPRELRELMQEMDARGEIKDWKGLFTRHFGEDLGKLEREWREGMEPAP